MKKLALAALVGIMLTSTTGCGTVGDTDVTITVTDKDRVCDGGKNGDCKYLVFTDKETFKNVDSMLNGKFNSSDIQGRLQVGHTYRVHVEGYRSGFLSSYRNIVEIKSEVDG